ncbi:1-propanol dehydrogenase PduQ [Streptococcus suis]|uniref:1-propanol dehydrogenase PduQ n=1 Tax=Streptococcus suis TaxID=1307 RepID=UPI000CF365A7|nr:1-propanol dehydrogenase PduQ [Streptococcus suis]MDW8682331.1 1-propanol dehydrogenase PduQ [Streptococcus suis]MDW8758716.1 1-propanol dehydrogenase PduQ [Streptococcus suis]HEM5997312.1 iron-containing alcohol dehydrogenase [Streptococcus suis]HEM6082207.1 iron-containing alcohol dehydrogenase [Streptococcus suis]HEM6137159.1 iron-containing alcohol dehydrogenase [Streptococcus suis]
MYKIFYKTELCIGEGALDQLKSYKDEHILVVADPFLRQSGQLESVLHYLDSSNQVIVFDDIVPDPPIETIVAGIQSVGSHSISIILTIGGGSAIDAAKAIYYFGKKMNVFADAILIAIPTTSGTGSEVTEFAVITDSQKEIKYPLVSREILPDIAILDSCLVTSLPEAITADTGMDVLTHAIEAYVSTNATDFSDALAEKAIKLVFQYLPQAYQNGNDSVAREKMHVASTLAGMAFNTASLGINHGLAHATGAKFHIPHGRVNSILMPHVIQYNANIGSRGIATEDKQTAIRYQEIAKLIGCSATSPVLGVRQLIEAVKKLQRKLDLPLSLRDYGVSISAFNESKEEIALAAISDKCTATNPRKPTKEEALEVLENAF